MHNTKVGKEVAELFLETAYESAREHLVEYAVLLKPDFDTNWHIDLVADRLEQIEKGEGKNLILTVPPRGTKTFMVQELFTSWYLAKNPQNRIISIGSTTRLASGFTTKARKNFAHPITNALFGNSINRSKQAESHWETLQGGGIKSFGVVAGVSGESADLVICDDVFRNAEQAQSKVQRDKIWNEYTQSISTRLLPGGKQIIINTRWHIDDLIGRIIENGNKENTIDDWEIINLPAVAEKDEQFHLSDGRIVGRKKGEALHPDRYDVDYYEKKKKSMGLQSFVTMYQGTPIAARSAMFKKEWFKYVTEKEVRSVEEGQGQKMIRFLAVDAAFSKSASADFTGFTDMRMDRNGNFYVRTWHDKLSPKELVDSILDKQKMFDFDRIFFEGQMYDEGIRAFLEDKANTKKINMPVEVISHNRASKDLRIAAIEPYLRNGEIFFVENWSEDLEEELLYYPGAKHDDIIDSLALALSGIREMRRGASKEKVRSQPIPFSMQ